MNNDNNIPIGLFQGSHTLPYFPQNQVLSDHLFASPYQNGIQNFEKYANPPINPPLPLNPLTNGMMKSNFVNQYNNNFPAPKPSLRNFQSSCPQSSFEYQQRHSVTLSQSESRCSIPSYVRLVPYSNLGP